MARTFAEIPRPAIVTRPDVLEETLEARYRADPYRECVPSAAVIVPSRDRRRTRRERTG